MQRRGKNQTSPQRVNVARHVPASEQLLLVPPAIASADVSVERKMCMGSALHGVCAALNFDFLVVCTS